jgi:hypothetical protein
MIAILFNSMQVNAEISRRHEAADYVKAQQEEDDRAKKE